MIPPFDPSKMDPKVLMELSQLVQQLPPEKLGKMQTLMHNMMAGYDVRAEMEEFEKSLPPGFREKLMSFSSVMGASQEPAIEVQQPASSPPGNPQMDIHEARLTILRGVADGKIDPEEAERLLFTP